MLVYIYIHNTRENLITDENLRCIANCTEKIYQMLYEGVKQQGLGLRVRVRVKVRVRVRIRVRVRG
jgi:hypothetical protein